MITSIYAAIAGLFLIFLSFRVIRLRRSQKVSIGSADVPELERAMRVQANFVEYTPITLLLLFLLEQRGASDLTVHVYGFGFAASRLLHFLGIRSADAPGVFRVLGMVGTFLVIAALSIALLMKFFALA